VKKLAKKKAVKKVENKKQSTFDKEMIFLIPIIFMVTLYMFAVRARAVLGNIGGLFWESSAEYIGDIFAYFRMQLFVIITVVFVLYLLFSVFTGDVKIQKHKVYIPMAIYAVLVIISYLVSEYKNVALWGYVERYEGTVSILCYMAILFYTMNVIKSEKAIKLVMKCFMGACFVLGIWGILQTFGVKLENLPQWLYIPSNLRGMVSGVEGTIVANPVSWLFSNQNYASFFMVFPICISAMSCIAEEDTKKKIMYAALAGLMMFCLWRAESLGGMVGFAVAVLAAIVVAGPKNIIKWRKSLLMLAVAGVVSVGASLPSIMGQLGSVTSLDKVMSIKTAYADEKSNEPLRYVDIDYIVTEGKDIIFSFADNEYKVVTEDGRFDKIVNGSGEEVAETNFMRVHEEQVSSYNLIIVETAKKNWRFMVTEGESYFVTSSGHSIKLDKTESIGFKGNEKFATNRGYIWSRTIPLLKETIIWGKGADTFAIYFPQDDYAGKYNVGFYKEGSNIVVDKPHNIYLGTAVNTGVVSMISYVAIFAIYLIECIKVRRNCEFNSFKDYIGMGICISVAGFMVSGLVNDSTVQMMPIVYVMLGIGFVINRLSAEEKDK